MNSLFQNYYLGIEDSNSPIEFPVYQNYPNPFNPITDIHYDLPKQTRVENL